MTALGLGGAAHVSATTFLQNFGPAVKPIGTALARSIGAALPLTSASPGVIYTFNFETGAPEREATLLGQLFLERAETIGRHRWNLGVSYQRVAIDSLNGDDIDELHDNIPIVDKSRESTTLTIPRFAIGLETHQFTTSATLGLSDSLDVNLTVPMIFSEFRLQQLFREVAVVPGQGPKPTLIPLTTSQTKLGLGDVFVRGKYRFLDARWAKLALGTVLRIPTGNEENFQGTGTVELGPLLYASSESFRLGRGLEVQAYLNAGVNFNVEDVDGSEPRYGVGLDCKVADRFSAAVAVLGRHSLRRIAPPGFFDFPRREGGRQFLAPLFGLRDRRPDFYDLSIGGRVNLWRQTLSGFINALVPLNEDGFRADVIPLVGIETVF